MKKIYNKLLGILSVWILIMMGQNGYAQVAISGKVSSALGGSLPGVNVVVKNTNTGTITDLNGKFSMEVPNRDAILVFSYVGFISEEMEVGTRANFEVELIPDIQSLHEIVVIGYGNQKREDVTTAIAQVKPEEFVPGAVRNVGELLRGKVAGLSLSTPSGDPEAEGEILLRGITSLFGSSSPLVLIDGFPGNLNAVSPNDIESVDILKDASASAIYGTRGKNGVILITTKKAQGKMDPVLDYSGYVSTERFQKTADFLDASDVRRLIDDGLILPAFDLGGETNWLDEISRNPLNHFHNLSLRGGTERTRYVANASYQMAEGIFLGSENEELKIRMDLEHYLIQNKLKVNANVLRGAQNYGAFNGWVYRQAMIRNPTDEVVDNEGSWVERPQFQYENPVALLKEQIYDNRSEWTWLTGSVSYYPVEDLELKVAGSQHRSSSAIGTYQTKQHISNVQGGRNGVAYIANGSTTENFLDITADYSKRIENHRFSALAGYGYVDWENQGSSITNYDFPTDKFSYHSIEQGRALREGRVGSGVDSYKSDWALISFFARVGYGFNDRYNILASVRREGSSRFGDANKWGTFPAISAGWTLSNESFLQNFSFVNNLKLRAGYGRTGSISSEPYQALTRYAYSPTQFYFDGTNWVSILTPISNPNPNLGWETNIEYNFGLDFSLMDNRVSGTVDYYDRTLEDLVYDYPVPVPPNQFPSTRANSASMTNRGLEISLNFIPIQTNKFEWRSNLNYSRNENKLQSLSSGDFQLENDFVYAGYTGDPIQLSTHKVEVGEPIGSFFGYKSVGLQEDPDKPGWGNWVIEGAEGERKLLTAATSDDRQILGNGLPGWYAAWNNYLSYGNFDLSITMRGAFDYQILNFQRMFYESPTLTLNRLASSFEKVDGLYINSPQSYVSHYIEQGDFWKIDNVTIGYNFSLESNSAIKKARVYLSGSNLAVITAYKGLDPEVSRLDGNGLSPGNDFRDKYPTTSVFTLGVDLSF